MTERYNNVIHGERVRFYIDFGPPSLFERVHYKMKDVHKLYMDGSHFNMRLSERDIPDSVLDKIKNFNISEWSLKTAEVRLDRGKFLNSTWESICDGKPYWVTIGIGNFVTTIVQRSSSGVEKCIRSGDYYDFVEKVNRELMDNEMDS